MTDSDTAINKVNLAEKLGLFREFWTPKIVGELNGQHVKLAKLKGSFVAHSHRNEDELFLVLRGELTIRMETGDVTLREGEFAIVPKGVEHQPVAKQETHILLFEPAETAHTGEITSDMTVTEQEWI